MAKAGTKIVSSFSVHKNCLEIASAFMLAVNIIAKKSHVEGTNRL